MIDHLGVQAADVEAALSFYVSVFAPIGMPEARRYPTDDQPVVGIAGADGCATFVRDLDGNNEEAVHHTSGTFGTFGTSGTFGTA